MLDGHDPKGYDAGLSRDGDSCGLNADEVVGSGEEVRVVVERVKNLDCELC